MIIEFSFFNSQIFIPLLFPIFIQIEGGLRKYCIKEENILFKIFRYYLSYTFSLTFILIIKFRTRSSQKKIETKSENKKNENENKNTKIVLEKEKKRKSSFWINPLDIELKKYKREKRMQSIFFMILLVVISLSSNLFNQIFKDKDIDLGKQSIGVFFEIINFIILSVIFLNDKLYKHHRFSLYIISFTLLNLFISFVICLEDNKVFKSIWYYFIYAFLYTLYDVLGKKYMNLFFSSPYSLMFSIGLLSIFILLLYDVIVYKINIDKSGIILGFQKNVNISSFLLFFLDIFLEFLWNLGIWLTIYYFTPCHFIISESISEYIYYTKYAISCNEDKLKKNFSLFNLILYSTAYIINIIATLIFNEIIIINIKGLGDYTKKKILEREKIDSFIASQKYKGSINTLASSQASNLDIFNGVENDLPQSLISLDKIDVNIHEDNIK